jgi:hypothetical protein
MMGRRARHVSCEASGGPPTRGRRMDRVRELAFFFVHYLGKTID